MSERERKRKHYHAIVRVYAQLASFIDDEFSLCVPMDIFLLYIASDGYM